MMFGFFQKLGPAVLTVTALLSSGADAWAGELKLSTVRIELNDKQSSTALIVSNVGETDTLVHFRVMSWGQAEAEDVLSPTQDVMVNPPMAAIAAGQKQMIRIGYKGNLQQQTERTYRLFVEEVPRQNRERVQAVETYLKISLPVFVAPLAKTESRLSGVIDRTSGQPVLRLHNASGSHVRLVSYTLSTPGRWQGEKQTGLHYVLPGATMALPLPADARISGATTVELLTDAGVIAVPLQ